MTESPAGLMNPRRDELAYLSATEALALFRSRELSPMELMHADIARAALSEPTVNAFAERLFDEALEQAQTAESRYLSGDRPPRALEGIPVATKEHHPIAGRTPEAALRRTSARTSSPRFAPTRTSCVATPASSTPSRSSGRPRISRG